MAPDFDIAICGAGPVGLALAAMLVQRDAPAERIVLIDAKSIGQAAADPRSIAVSYGSRQLLDEIGAWPGAATPIHDIHVSRRGHFGRTLIDHNEYDVPALGYVTRYGSLITALARVTETHPMTSMRPVQVSTMTEHDERVNLQLADGRQLTAAIAIQSEGGLFMDQEAKSIRRDYEQTAVISHVEVDAPIAGRAFERFTDEGPLALLPQDSGYALVWCGRPATAERLKGLPDAQFLAELQAAFGFRLGRFVSVTQRSTFPLGLNARPSASARTVAIGNAAQTLHPVAGQGFNLGLRDAAVLARLLARDATPEMLQKFVQMRQSDRSTTIQLTDAMARAFAGIPARPLSQAALSLSLSLLDCARPLKRLLAEQMMFGRR